MAHPIPSEIEAFAQTVAPDPGPLVAEMDDRAEREEFPTVGPAVGGWFLLLAELVDAERIFEFGSGFGYSAYWFASALPADGEIVLTEIDADELEDARTYLERAGVADRAHFEHGDALETIERYDGPFDVVLIDNEKVRYREAFEAVRDDVPPGGLILADNALTAGDYVNFAGVRDLLAGGNGEGDREFAAGTRGVADYLAHVRAAEEFETALLPLGEGVAVTRRI